MPNGVTDYIALDRVIGILERHPKKAEELKLLKSQSKLEGVRLFPFPPPPFPSLLPPVSFPLGNLALCFQRSTDPSYRI